MKRKGNVEVPQEGNFTAKKLMKKSNSEVNLNSKVKVTILHTLKRRKLGATM